MAFSFFRVTRVLKCITRPLVGSMFLTTGSTVGSSVSLPSSSTVPSCVCGSEKRKSFSQLKRSFSFSAVEEGLAHHCRADIEVRSTGSFCSVYHMYPLLHVYAPKALHSVCRMSPMNARSDAALQRPDMCSPCLTSAVCLEVWVCMGP